MKGDSLKTHDAGNELRTSNLIYREEVKVYTIDALRRDLGSEGDVTTQSVVSGGRLVKAEIRAQETGVLAGVEELRYFLVEAEEKKRMFPSLKVEFVRDDGDLVKDKDVILQIEGEAVDVLKVERMALNLLQRMSGVATKTNELVSRLRSVDDEIVLAPTRKTLWGLLDKRAVSVGGGATHRLNLADAIMLKDTHLKLGQGALEGMLARAVAASDGLRFLEVEVESYADAKRVCECFSTLSPLCPLVLMLDNMSPGKIKEIVCSDWFVNLNFPLVLEASGGISGENILEYAKTGVDVISMGELTMAAPAMSFHLKIVD